MLACAGAFDARVEELAGSTATASRAGPASIPATSASGPASVRGAPRLQSPETIAFWERVWADVDKVDQATHHGANWKRRINLLGDTAGERRIVGLSQGDEQDLFRTRLLQWHLERIKGRRQDHVDPPRGAMHWLRGEPWLAAQALPPGPTRCAAMLLALEEAGASRISAQLATAERQAREELADANVLGAAALAERVGALEPTPARLELWAWAMTQAARTAEVEREWNQRTQLVERARGGRVADEALESPWRVIRARAALGRDDELAARAELGAALALGSSDAAVLTARLLLARGERERARVLARAWVDTGPSSDMAGALWALARLGELPTASPARAPPGPDRPLR
jgi:hypothetical protein